MALANASRALLACSTFSGTLENSKVGQEESKTGPELRTVNVNSSIYVTSALLQHISKGVSRFYLKGILLLDRKANFKKVKDK